MTCVVLLSSSCSLVSGGSSTDAELLASGQHCATMLLVGTNESSSCPKGVDDVSWEGGLAVIAFESDGTDCTSDSVPLSFVIGRLPAEIESVEMYGREAELLEP